MSDAIYIFDNSNKYVFINKAARDQTPYINGKVQNCFEFAKFYNLDGSEVTYEEMPLNMIKSGQSVIDKTIFAKINDKIKYVGISGTPIFDENNNFVMGVMCSRDITSRMECERDLRDKQESLLLAERREKETLENAMKIKDEFLSNMSHEFKTPLTVINAAIQTINSLYGTEMSPILKKHIGTIHRNSLRQLRLVNNSLDITKYKEGYIKLNEQNLDIVFVTNSIIQCIKTYSGQKGVNLEFSCDLASKFVLIDEDKYERILLNLLSNAVKFTPPGKSVFVHITFNNKSIEVTVRDEGIGIPKEKHEYVFERFGQVDGSLTRQAEGTGIGLSLVKSIIAALEGTISLNSEVGKGSTFTFSIPIKELETVKDQKAKMELGSHIMQSAAVEFSVLKL
jgi:signal transduction histidine kinase